MDNKENLIYEDDLNLMQLCRELVNHWVVIVALALVAAVAGFLFSKAHRTYEYTASFDMIVTAKRNQTHYDPTKKNPKINHPQLPGKELKPDENEITEEDIALAESLVETYASVMQSNVVLNPVIDILELDMSYSELLDCISVTTEDHSQLVHITVRGNDKNQVESIAQQISRVSPQLISRTARAGYCQAFSKVEIAQTGVSPSVKTVTILFAFLGAIAAIGFLLVRFLLNSSIEDDEDIQRYLDLPVVGVIPAIKEVK